MVNMALQTRSSNRERNENVHNSETVATANMGRTLKQSVPRDVAELIVVRHGQTESNASGVLQGQAESDMTVIGVKQAVAVAERMAKGVKDIVAIYSSDLRRAFDTAQIIAETCNCSKVIKMESLRERHLGKLQGLTRAEARVMAPELYASSSADLVIPGGGESLNQAYARSKTAMEEIAQRHLGERVVVVSHGCILRGFHLQAKGVEPAAKVRNTSVNVFQISASNEWNLSMWGDVNHLQSIQGLEASTGGDEL